MLPQFFLVALRRPTALLITNLHNTRHHFVKLLNVLVAPVHVLKHSVKQRVHNVGAEICKYLSEVADRVKVVLIALK